MNSQCLMLKQMIFRQYGGQEAPLRGKDDYQQQNSANGSKEIDGSWTVKGQLLGLLLLIFSIVLIFHQQSAASKQTQLIKSERVANHLRQLKAGTGSQERQETSSVKVFQKAKGGKQFRSIIWLQTNYELEAMKIKEALAAQNLIYFGRQEGFEVRIVNNLNAYDWLSAEMIAFIKDTHQKSKAELPVFELLRLALLYEHGGVSVRLPNVLLMGGLGWVADLLRGRILEEAEKKALGCQLPRPEVLMLHEDRKDGSLWFRDYFMAARPKARLLLALLNNISAIAKSGEWPYAAHNPSVFKQQLGVVSFPNIAEALVNTFQGQSPSLCEEYGLESFHENSGPFIGVVPDELASAIIRSDERAFEEAYGRKHLLALSMESILDDIVSAIETGDLSFGNGNSLLKNKLMAVEGNKWLLARGREAREVHFCVVSLQTLEQGQAAKVEEQLARLAKQTFTAWNFVAFVEGLASVSRKAGQRAVLVNASQYEGLNLQRAATKYCDPKSVMLLLDHDEVFASNEDLQTLANHFKPVGRFAGFLNIRTLEQFYSPSVSKGKVQRVLNKANKEVLVDIRNFLRAFTVQAYRFVAHMDLRHSRTGRYFDRELPLLSMLEISEDNFPCNERKYLYSQKRIEALMDIPREKVFTNITILSQRFKNPEFNRFQYFAKFRHLTLCEAIDRYQFYDAPVDQMVVFNDGKEHEGLAARKGMPELIPRKIHQIWVKGQIPAFKQLLMKQLRDAHPDYEYFLWTEQNMTRENFPESYDLIQTLLEFDPRSRYSKMAMIADIARYEIVYRHGGFYFDTNYLVFGNSTLDQFLTYSFLDAAQISPLQRVFRDNGMLGAAKNHSHLARIASHRAFSIGNHYGSFTIKETGPFYFGRVQRGKEELDETMFQQSFEEFYPNYIYELKSNNYDKCQTLSTTPDSEILFRTKKRSYLKNCSDIYYYAYGVDFGREGESWNHPRW